MQELSEIAATEGLKIDSKQQLPELLEILQEAQRIELRNDVNHSWVSSREMRKRLARRGVQHA